jgi:hypothetical protein
VAAPLAEDAATAMIGLDNLVGILAAGFLFAYLLLSIAIVAWVVHLLKQWRMARAARSGSRASSPRRFPL